MKKLDFMHIKAPPVFLEGTTSMKNRSSLFILCAALFAAAILALPSGSWADEDYVAKCGDKGYDTLQEAIEACPSGGEVELLKDTEEKVTLSQSNGFASKDITLNLGGNTLSSSTGIPVIVSSAGNIIIKNGFIDAHREGVYVSSYIYGDAIVTLENVNVTSDILQAVSVSDETLTISGGTYTVKSNNSYEVLLVNGGKVTVKDGTLTSGKKSSSCVRYNGGSLTIEGGTFSNNVNLTGSDTDLTITGGTFGNATNAAYVDDGYAMYLSSATPGRYQVLEATKARQEASWGVTVNGCAVYFDSKSDAQAYAEQNKDGEGNIPAVYKLHMTVSYLYKGDSIYAQHVEHGDELGDFAGTLPTVLGYEFTGWAIKLEDGTYQTVDSTYEPIDDLELHSLWIKSGDESDDKGDDESGDESGDKDDKTPTEDPEDEDTDEDADKKDTDEEADKKDADAGADKKDAKGAEKKDGEKGEGDKKALPQTGDAAAAAALQLAAGFVALVLAAIVKKRTA